MDTPQGSRRALFILLMGSLILVAFVLRPLVVPLFLAAVFAGALYPTHNRISRALKGKSSLAAGLLVIVVLLLVLGPLLGLSAFVVKEGVEAMHFVTETIQSDGVEGLVSRLPGPLESAARAGLEKLPLDGVGGVADTVQDQVSARGGEAAVAVGGAVAATGKLVFQTAMMLIALFFFLTQKDNALRWVDDASPLRSGQTRELLAETRKVTVAVLRSSILTAAVQAVAAVAGFYLARVPHPLFFGAVTFFFALIPAIGAASVVLLSAALMFFTGHPYAALFLAVWGVLVVGLADNVVKPWLIRGGVQMHGAVVFFSLLGGLAAFGAIGLVLGPLAVSFFIALLRIYRRDYGDGPPDGGRGERGRSGPLGPMPEPA